MQRYILKRLAQTLVTIWIVTLVVFMLTRITGDPVDLLLSPDASAEDRAVARKAWGLDQPVYVQYWRYVSGMMRGDFGTSIKWDEPTLNIFLERFGATVQLATFAMVVSATFGITIGVLSAKAPGGKIDTFGRAWALAGQSMPTFWVGIMLILVFAVWLRVLPTSGTGGFRHLILPGFTLGWYSMAAFTRLARSAMLNVLDSEFIKMCRIKGLPERLVIWKHAVKNASLPILTLFGVQFVQFLSGSLVTETVFAWPGVGRLAVWSVYSRDYPVVQTIVVIVSSGYLFVNLFIDILYAYIDPRIRYE
ncbi:MAG TPA: ABC transporter permease [Candidatus Methylomirabilis sp.]|nr:ABC transporter permease [Candidatus Methylomirabilis sp.]